jgi:hypothetical protein
VYQSSAMRHADRSPVIMNHYDTVTNQVSAGILREIPPETWFVRWGMPRAQPRAGDERAWSWLATEADTAGAAAPDPDERTTSASIMALSACTHR